jgi:hypothetical protein
LPKRKTKNLCIYLVLPICLALPLRADPEKATEASLTPAQQELLTAMTDAVSGSDRDAYQRLYHPKSLTCINDDNRAAYEAGLRQALSVEFPEDHEAEVHEIDWSIAEPSWMSVQIMPIRASHRFFIDSSSGEGPILSRLIVFEEGRWFLVNSCLNPSGMEWWRSQRKSISED